MRKSNGLYSLVAENSGYLYYVTDKGHAVRKSKTTHREYKLSSYVDKHGNALVCINYRKVKLKKLVAEAFIRGYKPGMCVIVKDKNPKNCAAANLCILSKSAMGKATGHKSRSKAVMIDGELYRSVRKAAIALHCSYQTLLDYMNCGKVKNSVLGGISAEYVSQER